jgi:hypothetical protein
VAKRKRGFSNAKFQRGKAKVARRGGVRDPGAVMAATMRKAYGQKALTRASVAGRKRKRR